MSDYPTVKKEFGDLSKLDRLKDATTTLIAGAVVSVGLAVGVVVGTTDASAQASQIMSSQEREQGQVILLHQSIATDSDAANISPFHRSHYSHMSHRSHYSHYSSR